MNFLSEEEEYELLVTFNDTAVAYPKDKTVVDLFEEQAAKTPANIAVVFEDTELTYQQLDERSNQLAHYLKENYQIRPDDLVAIQLERSEWMLISILGVLKAGGAYVPIDPHYPQERISYMQADTRCKVCLDEAALTHFKASRQRYPTQALPLTATADNLIYVLYTSGSTGKPKGVLLEHRGLVNRLLWMKRQLQVEASDVFLQKTPVTFDVSVWELLLPLVSGSKLVVARPEGHKDPLYLHQVLAGHKVSIVHFVPSMLSAALPAIGWERLAGLRHVVCSGEALGKPLEEAFRARAPFTSLHNYYGPTEASIDVTAINLSRHATLGKEVPIGRPVDNTRIYIVNEKHALQPAGVSGEILIGGDQVARGYLNQEGLTKEKFIASPFKPAERLYKTGDLGRWLPDGTIEFIGRKDDQVKIRGHRIELAEIEQALAQHQQINQAVVLARENQSAEKELVAYITSKVEQNTSELRAYLAGTLPAYMLPAHFVQLEAMPLTASGKVDKKSLPDPQGLGLSGGVAYVAPGTEQEKALASVWSDVLKRTGIGIKDSFYNLGGDSIKSIQVVARLKQHGYRLKVEHILKYPVLEDLCRLMELTTQVSDQSEVSGEVVLTPIQDWFFKAEEIKVPEHYNQSVVLYSKEQLEGNILEKSLADLTRHHDALRMVYQQSPSGAWQQFNQDTSAKRYTLDFYDLRQSGDALGQMMQLGEAQQASIKLSAGPLLRVLHFRLQDGDRLGLIIHHLVVDGVSWRILLEDLSTLYTSYKEGKKPSLPSKTDSLQRWAFLQQEYAASPALDKERTYWQKVSEQPLAALPQDKPLPEGRPAVLDSAESFGLDQNTTELLQTRVHRVYNTEINDVLLTGLGLALREVLTVDKSVLKMEGHGREEILDGVDISRTVGWFTTVYPFVLQVADASNQTQSLVRVKESLRSIPNKGIGYGILSHLSRQGLDSKLTPEITFNYLGDFGSNLSNEGKSLFEYASERIGSNASRDNTTDAILDVSGMLVRGELGMSIRYSSARYEVATIKKIAASYKKNLEVLIETLAKADTTYLTPSDLSFKGLGQEELSVINSDNDLEDVYELSPLQEGIYYHWLTQDSSALYFEQISYRVRAKVLDVEKLKGAYDRLTARHAVLRTSFTTEYAGRSLQIVRKEVASNFTYQKLDSQADRQAHVALIKQQDRERGFDLSSGSQMRLHVVELSDGEYEFVWSHHHVLMDGWCMSVLINDFNELLSAAIKGTAPALSPVVPYADYINWLRTIDRESSLSYWKDYLSGYASVAEIPFKAQAADTTYVESRERLQVGGDLFKKVDALCTEIGITQNTFVQAVWGYLLSRYNNTSDVVFGIVVSGRPADLPGVEEMIGLFSNTVPVRVKYAPDNTPVELLKALQEQSIRSASHHYVNLSEVQAQSELGMELMNHIMLFENFAVKELENEGILNTQREEGLSVESMEVIDQSNYDFNIAIAPSSVALMINIRYNANRYDNASLKHLIDHFGRLINAFAHNANQPLSTLDYLSEEEKHTLLVSCNDTAVAYPKDKTIVDLFEEQAARTPHNIAVVFAGKELTYQQLDEKSNQLAHYLRENYQVRPDDLVGIQLERSEWVIIAILGVLKAGGAYVPIDADYPSSRKAYIVKDSALKLLITETSFIYDIDYYQGAVFAIDVEFDAQRYPAQGLSTTSTPAHLAYVIYTSGSTGVPKGVMVEHRAIANTILAQIDAFRVETHNRGLQLASFSFDASISEVFIVLLSGARLLMAEESHRKDPALLTGLISSHAIDIATLSPSLLSKIEVGKLQGLKTLITAGESAHYQKAVDFLAYGTYYNAYGPTETSICATICELGPPEALGANSIPIGKPIANTQVYILSQQQAIQPVGVAGEIYIGGDGLARGYLNQEGLTKEKFIANPFKPGERLYRTGDLGRRLPDGNIAFIGRKDDQVKIRGHRIELAEIEQALLNHQHIEQAVVLARENQSGEKELVAYITSKADQNTNELRAYLAETLPAYMLPAHFVQLEAMPLTTSGKVDKQSLPDPEGLGLASGVEYVAPRTAQERVLVSVWSDVLKREGIGIKDSFYNLGGDSIKSIQVVARLKQHGYRLKVEHLLRTPVVEELARLMERTTQVSDQNEVSGEVVLTPIQDWFFKAEQIKVPEHYNQSVVLYSKEQLDGEILEQSLADLTRHHDALRMVYQQSPSGAWQQFNQDTSAKRYTLDFYDLRQSEDVLGQMASLGEAQQASIKLSAGPLLRVLHFRLQDGDRLGLIIHHLVVDGVSWRILLEDLSNLYTSYKEGKKPGLPSKTDSFQRWALLQQEYAASPALDKERTYWQKVSEQPLAALPQDKPLPEGRQAVLDSAESFGLDQNTTELLQTRVHRVYNTEINDVLLTGLGLALKEVLTVDKSVLKMEGHGREEILDGVDISRTVGWFTTVYPFVLQVSDSSNQTQSLVGVKESLRSIPNKGIGYGILSHLSRQGLDSKLTPEITFNYLGDFGSNVSNEGDSLFEYASERIGADASRDNTTDAILDVSGMLVKGELGMSIRYSSARYEVATIRKIAASYKKNLEVLIETLAKADTTYLTPSDLSFKGLSQEELSVINSDNTLEDVYELSPLQEGIYYHWLAEDSNSLYFEQTSYKVRTKGLAIEKLKGAYDRLTARHAVLRTSFTTEYASRSLQIVRKEVASNFTYQKLDRQADQQAQVAFIKQQDRERGFDLSSGSQMRLHVVELSDGEYEFVWSHHHVLMDGWCTGVLINDFNELLSAAIKGITPDLLPVVPYADYINWLRTVDRESSLSYWKNYLSGYASVAEIPFKAEAADTTYVESSERLRIEGDLFKKVDALCTEIGITQNTFVQAVWGYLLSRYNNTSDVVFGAVVSGRPADLPGVEDMIGLFINTIPVRVKYAPDDTPVTLLKELQEQSIRSASHHYVNLSEVQAQSELGMELMNHIMLFENYAVKELKNVSVLNTQREEGLSVESVEVFERTNYDFNVVVSPSAVSLGINIKYNLNRYDELSLKSLMRHLDKLINAFAHNANQPLSTLDYLSEAEKHQLLVTFNDTAVAYPKDKTIVDLFEEQAAKTPDNIAVVFEDTELTYQQLDEKSNQLAHYLRENYHIQPDDLVGIQLERSEWMIIAILGVLKAGGAYVPIDPHSPPQRVAAILEDSGCKVLLDAPALAGFRQAEKAYAASPITSQAKAHHLAYVIYTSGSTGKPKGVMIEHGNVTNFFTGMTAIFGEQQGTLLSMTNFTFDISVLELLWTLTKGYKVVIQPEARHLGEQHDQLAGGEQHDQPGGQQAHARPAGNYSVYAHIRTHQVSHLQITPSMGALLNEHLSKDAGWASIRHILLGGEPVRAWLVKELYQKLPHAQVYNMYGPTETTVWSTVKALEKDQERILIGKPIANTRIYVLDQNGNPVASGVEGELYIGGAGVARGYTRRELTEGSFRQSPFVAGDRLYRTGDYGSWLKDGSLYCAGRKDQQVKIRGHRIELAEIEQALEQHQHIEQAVVVVRGNEEKRNEEKQLVAYITSGEQQQIGALRTFLQEHLPHYMIPDHFVQLEKFPLNTSGKIDKKLLPAPQGLGLTSGVEYVAPRNEIEEKLVKIWEEVLQIDRVGVLDDFFALGGHSLKAMQFTVRAEKVFGVKIDIRNLLSKPTIDSLSEEINTLKWVKDKSEEFIVEGDELII